MVKLYVKRIIEGQMTLEQVPARWREAVREALEDIDLTPADDSGDD